MDAYDLVFGKLSIGRIGEQPKPSLATRNGEESPIRISIPRPVDACLHHGLVVGPPLDVRSLGENTDRAKEHSFNHGRKLAATILVSRHEVVRLLGDRALP